MHDDACMQAYIDMDPDYLTVGVGYQPHGAPPFGLFFRENLRESMWKLYIYIYTYTYNTYIYIYIQICMYI